MSSNTYLADLSLTEAADAVRNGDATSEDLLAACLANIDAAEAQVNATIWLDREGAMEAARAADKTRAAGRATIGRLCVYREITGSDDEHQAQQL